MKIKFLPLLKQNNRHLNKGNINRYFIHLKFMVNAPLLIFINLIPRNLSLYNFKKMLTNVFFYCDCTRRLLWFLNLVLYTSV